MEIILDIETIPCDFEVRKLLPPIKPPGNVKKVAEWMAKNKTAKEQEQYLKTALDGTFGRIFSIGLLFTENNRKTGLAIYGDEKSVLDRFWSTLDSKCVAPQIITHNGYSFDIPFILKRSVIHDLRPPLNIISKRYRDTPVYDTMQEWSGWAYGEYVKLDTLAKVLGVPGKTGDGSEVYGMYRKKQYTQIAEYCMDDVITTHNVHQRMTYGTDIIRRVETEFDFYAVSE